MPEAENIFECCLFIISAELIIEADKSYMDAKEAELQGRPRRAYNCNRRGDDLMRRARKMAGDKGLPWGVK